MNNRAKIWFTGAGIVLPVFALGLWAGRKQSVFRRVPASPSPAPLTRDTLDDKAEEFMNDAGRAWIAQKDQMTPLLTITEISASQVPDPHSDKSLMLKIAVKKRPSTVIDPTQVKIQVFFYDTVDDKEIKLTDAEVNYEWLTPGHDWAGADAELLAVTYSRPKGKFRAAVNRAKKGGAEKPNSPLRTGPRKYLGYIVRIYYKDQLQDKRGEPSMLLALFPPPPQLPIQRARKKRAAGLKRDSPIVETSTAPIWVVWSEAKRNLSLKELCAIARTLGRDVASLARGLPVLD